MMVEAMILISESAYKQLLHSQTKYLELINEKSSSNSENSKDNEKVCKCNDQFGEGILNCECKNDSKSEENLPIPTSNIPNSVGFKTSSEFFSDLVKQSWYKRSPRKARELAEILFYSSGLLIGKDNTLHFEGSTIHGSNIYEIIRNEITKGKKYIPGKILIERILEKSNYKLSVKQRKPREKPIETEEDLDDDWYQVL